MSTLSTNKKLSIGDIKGKETILKNKLKEIQCNIDLLCDFCKSTSLILLDAEQILNSRLACNVCKESITSIRNRDSFILQLFKQNNIWKPRSLTCSYCLNREILIDGLERLMIIDVIVFSVQLYKWKQIMFSLDTNYFLHDLISS